MAPKTPPPPLAANSIALAAVAASEAPLVLLDADLSVVAASTSFYRAFEIDPATSAGRPLFGAGKADVRKLRSLLKAALSGDVAIEAYEMAILFQELQHRVANSLRIIASVLMQRDRRGRADESRTYLRDAENRVMSLAALQHQLATTNLRDVALRAYLTELCESIGASMISDHDQLSLTIVADDSLASADVAVRLGLIVTELVMNALKHAFPNHRNGKIIVAYASQGDEWNLTVSDDGVGMPKDAENPKSGLGGSIVEALAAQLRAVVEINDAAPGAVVSVTHRPSTVSVDATQAASA